MNIQLPEISNYDKITIDKFDNIKTKIESRNNQIDTKELKQACVEFESFLIYYLLKQMRKTIPHPGLFYGGRSEEIFQEMLDEQLGRNIASAGGIGLGDLLYQQLKT